MKVRIGSWFLVSLLAGPLAPLPPASAKEEPGTFPGHWTSTLEALDCAHTILWNQRVNAHGIILDHIGELPTPEDCRLGKPNALGWWSPIEDGPMFTGLYLPAACERARRTGDPADQAKVQRLVQGLLKCASVSSVPGFIARGVGTDGQCHYPLGSDDQTHPWFYGLHTYVTSGLASSQDRKRVVDKIAEVASALEALSWRCPCDGSFKGQFRGSFQGHLFRDAVRYLYLLRATCDVTQDGVWLERYRKAASERPHGGDLTRAEICAAGFGLDRQAIPHLDEHQMWIYAGSQGSLAKLLAMETDPSLRSHYRAGLDFNATHALPAIQACRQFNNQDTKVYGDAHWREAFPVWRPQSTPADAEALSRITDPRKRGERKHYEARFMRNPLAAAAIVALAGDGRGREAIESAIRHYDYTKLYRSEFFFAECAYYALPALPSP